ncbi:MAG: MBL fold metallo-hydrolase [Deltaproteobacteria bacterium]|nr:MBL fold metallo-hydrolase [Deltaproteobacteria bacterium]
MAEPARPTRETRRLRRRAEHAFRRAELAVWQLGEPGAEVPTALRDLDEALARLDEPLRHATGLATRRTELDGALQEGAVRDRYVRDHGVDEVTRVTTSAGDRIYRIVAPTFPGHENYLYVVVTPAGALLWDVGSGPMSRPVIQRGLEVIRRVHLDPLPEADFRGVLVSHAHIDHFGDAAFFRDALHAPLMVHELDARVLTRFEERVVVTAKDLGVFLARAGIPRDRREQLEGMYLAGKDFFRSVEVDRRLRHDNMLLGRLRVIHTPGHCPGHICLRVDNALLVADQVLEPITPNLSPQSVTPFNGLENYLGGLRRLRLLEGIDHVLPAHAEPIPSLGARIDRILEHHQERLARVTDSCAVPRTVAEVADALYGAQEGYNVLLALTEAGAHVEYLHQYGRLRIANVDEVARERDPVLRYVTD